MSELKNDPSELYDADFMKKREGMADSLDDDEKDSEKISDEEYSQDAYEERSGLFSRLRQRKGKRKKDKKAMEDSYKDSYDIFDLEELFDEENGNSEEAENAELPDYGAHDMDDINALLESVGIMPIGKEESESAVSDEPVINLSEDENIVFEESSVTDEMSVSEDNKATEKTRVIGDLSSKVAEAEGNRVSEKTKHFAAIKTDANNESIRPQVDVHLDGSHNPKSDIHDESQILLDGYADEEGPAKIPEEVVEVELKKTRRNLIDNFRVLAKSGSDKAILEPEPTGEAKSSITDSLETSKGEDIFKAVDKAGKKKKASEFFKRGAKTIKAASQKAKKKEQMISATALSKEFKARRKKRELQSRILCALAAVSLILSFLASSYNPGGALDFLFGNGARIYTLISLLMLIGGAVVSLDMFKRAIETIGSFKSDSNVLTILLCVFVAVHHIAMLVTGMYPDTGMVLYSAYALFVLAVQAFSEEYMLSGAIKTISFMAKGGKLTGVQQIDNKADAAALGHGISDNGEPKLYFGADVDMPSNFEQMIYSSRVDEKFYSYSGTIVLAASFIYAIVLSITTKSASVFTGALIGSICLCMPVMRSIVISILSKKVNNSLKSSAAVIAGIDECENIGRANAVVFDTEDIFVGKISKFRKVPGSRMAMTDAIVYAASTLKQTKSVIADEFDEFLKEAEIKLPDAEDVVYEERLGYSSWVAGRKVLVGNREMLVQHSVEVPTPEEEKAYSKGKSVMYVVVEGIIAATFIVTYAVRTEVRRSIINFNKTGLILMLKTGEPCLDEMAVATRLGADAAAIKIISTNGSEIITQYRNNQSMRKDSGLVCIKKQRNLLPLVTAAHGMFSAERLATVINIVGIVFNFILMTACAALKVSTGFSVLTIIFLQAAWSVGAFFLGKSRIH
ncbi:MAG: hypothetical protein NC122_05675 [Faecalibacterium sp.]|nr:hypothetical protein [Ruminococcus sp.]MCM1391195.1 hypothetical protein [Ruminococcus sp.]MCM1485677.1 hypothetical protein [Faecalibacterium sp.]